MRTIMVMAVMAMLGCGEVVSSIPEPTPEAAKLPLCGDLKCEFVDSWSYMVDGHNVLRHFCDRPVTSTCDETGCLSTAPQIECREP